MNRHGTVPSSLHTLFIHVPYEQRYTIKNKKTGRRVTKQGVTILQWSCTDQPHTPNTKTPLLTVCYVMGTHRDRGCGVVRNVRDTQLVPRSDFECGAQHKLDLQSPRGGLRHGVITRVGMTRMVDQRPKREESQNIARHCAGFARGDHVGVAGYPVGIVEGGGETEGASTRETLA